MSKQNSKYEMTTFQRFYTIFGPFLLLLAPWFEPLIPSQQKIETSMLIPFIVLGIILGVIHGIMRLTRWTLVISNSEVSGLKNGLFGFYFGQRTSFPIARIDHTKSLMCPPRTLTHLKRCLICSLDGEQIYVPYYLTIKQFNELKEEIKSNREQKV